MHKLVTNKHKAQKHSADIFMQRELYKKGEKVFFVKKKKERSKN